MDTFEVIQPSALLTPYVKQYWFLRLENVVKGLQRMVPFGYTALTFNRGNYLYSSVEKSERPISYLHGITTEYSDIIFTRSIDMIFIVFQPEGANVFFNIPLHELATKNVSLHVLNDPYLTELEQQLQDTTDNQACISVIEQFFLRRLYKTDMEKDKRIQAVISAIHCGENNINKLAETACLGYKQFKRIFTEQIGINPKEYLQIVRFQKLHHLLQTHSSMSLSQLAYECGYYDKSHLIKEVRDFSGFTPTQLHQACDPVYSRYHALFRSAFVDLPLK